MYQSDILPIAKLDIKKLHVVTIPNKWDLENDLLPRYVKP